MAALCLLVVAAVACHFWVAAQAGPHYRNFTQQLTERLASGHLDLAARPDPRLLALQNPYDPAKNEGYRLLDASLFGGHYYLYFGLTPFAVLLVPYFWVTGQQLTEATTVAVLCSGGLAAAGVFLFFAMGWATTRLGRWLLLTGGASMAFGSTLLLVRRPTIYEIEIASAYLFLTTALALSAAAVRFPRRSSVLLGGAGACLALAFGSRPNYALAIPIWTTWLIATQRAPSAGGHHTARRLGKILLPMAAVGLLLGWYNWQRFGNPFEFGFKYQLMTYDRPAVGFWSWANFPYNLFRYLAGTWRMGPYFPFVLGQGRDLAVLPKFHEPTEYLYGVFLTVPALWLVFLRPWLRGLPSALSGLTSLLLAIAAGNLFVLLGMGNGSYRYFPDFLPAAQLAVAVLAMVAADAWRGRSWLRALLAGAVTAASLWTIFFSMAAQFALLDIFRTYNPAAFQSVARALNQPTFLVAELTGRTPTVPSLRVRLPQDKFGSDEPLLVTGLPAAQDFVYLYFTGPGLIQVGFEAIGRGGPVSKPFGIDYARSHRFNVYAGNLLPPEGHPMWRHMTSADVRLVQQELVVTVDDQIVLDADVSFHDPKGEIILGRSPNDAAFGSAFLGQVEDMTPVPARAHPSPLRWDRSAYGDLLLRLQLRAGGEGDAMPVLSLGNRHAGALYYLKYDERGRPHLLFQADHPDVRLDSGPLAHRDGATDRLDFSLAALRPPAGSSLGLDVGGPTGVKWNGTPVLADVGQPNPCSPTTVEVGENAVGLSGIVPRFEGKVTSVRRPLSAAASRPGAGLP